MSDELLEKFIKEYIQSQTMPQVLFTWHGGETLMRPLVFIRKLWNFRKNMQVVEPLIIAFRQMAHC